MNKQQQFYRLALLLILLLSTTVTIAQEELPQKIINSRLDSIQQKNDSLIQRLSTQQNFLDSLVKQQSTQQGIWKESLQTWNHTAKGMAVSLSLFQILLISFSTISGIIAFYLFRKYSSAIDAFEENKKRMDEHVLGVEQAHRNIERDVDNIANYRTDIKEKLREIKAEEDKAYQYNKDLKQTIADALLAKESAEAAMREFDRLDAKVQIALYKRLYPDECDNDEDARKKIREDYRTGGTSLKKIISNEFKDVRKKYVYQKGGNAVSDKKNVQGKNGIYVLLNENDQLILKNGDLIGYQVAQHLYNNGKSEYLKYDDLKINDKIEIKDEYLTKKEGKYYNNIKEQTSFQILKEEAEKKVEQEKQKGNTIELDAAKELPDVKKKAEKLLEDEDNTLKNKANAFINNILKPEIEIAIETIIIIKEFEEYVFEKVVYEENFKEKLNPYFEKALKKVVKDTLEDILFKSSTKQFKQVIFEGNKEKLLKLVFAALIKRIEVGKFRSSLSKTIDNLQAYVDGSEGKKNTQQDDTNNSNDDSSAILEPHILKAILLKIIASFDNIKDFDKAKGHTNIEIFDTKEEDLKLALNIQNLNPDGKKLTDKEKEALGIDSTNNNP